ncbi:MAG TPA: hypothetical protein VJV78_00480 [Polyangiales bacterium]|nr:hypothetical protein [Polyangiales bacterium]
MSVDPSKPREILVVHGVQHETDGELKQHELVQALLTAHLNGVPVQFTTDLYRYEGLNDAAYSGLESLLSKVLEALLRELPLAELIMDGVDKVMDLVEDVVISLSNGSTAHEICDALCERIMRTYRAGGGPLYVVAHSLGSVYALDAINQLIRTRPDGVFDRDRRRTWPVQGLITLGSPLGLDMFGARRRLTRLGPGRKWFRWFNYWSRTDPVVSGSFYGQPLTGYRIAERFRTVDPRQGWIVHDRVVDSGHAWLPAHLSYWNYAPLGDDLITFISS